MHHHLLDRRGPAECSRPLCSWVGVTTYRHSLTELCCDRHQVQLAAGCWQGGGQDADGCRAAAGQDAVADQDAVTAALWMLKVQLAHIQSVVLRWSWLLCRGWPRCRTAALRMLEVHIAVANITLPLLLRSR